MVPILSIITIIVLLFIWYTAANFGRIADQHISKKYLRNGLVSKLFQIDEQTSMNYWQGGQGKKTLVLIHGFGAAAKFQWERQIKTFSKEYNLVIPDLIYFGGSSSKSQEFGIDFQAECVQKLLAHLKIERFSLVSLSYGGVIAITIANNLPNQVEKLVICGSPIRYYTEEDIENTLQSLKVESFQELLLPVNEQGVKKLISIAYHKPPFLPNFILKAFHKGMFSDQIAEKKNLLSYLFDNRLELSARDFKFGCPVLLLWGANDNLVPTKIGKQLAEYFGKKQASFLTIDHAAHAPSAERPKVFNELVLKFLKS